MKLTLLDRVAFVAFITTVIGVSAVSAADGTKQAMVIPIVHDVDKKLVIMADGNKNLVLRLNYDRKCILDQVIVKGKEVISSNGVCSGIKITGTWYTTRHSLDVPKVTINGNTVTITDINFGPDNMRLTEQWNLTAHVDRITWRIDRTYHTEGTLEETHMPTWDFNNTDTWTGALLGTGGVAWCKLIDTPAATYGVHDGKATFFNKENNACMRIEGVPDGSGHIATRFIHQPNDVFTASYCVSKTERETKHHLRRFLADGKDVWKAFDVQAGEISSKYTLCGLDYAEEYDIGEIKYFDGNAIRDILNTIARVGIIDTNLIGANTWRHCGFICIEEQWLVLMGLAIDDQDFFDAARKSMDYYRDHAVLPNGRVKPRWAYDPVSCRPLPGTYDALGFHEMVWGYAMDSQAGYVGNVADLYDFNGDMAWVRTHKDACERALDYMLARDFDGDGLVEMMTDYHTDKKSSEVIDVIWACHENALVNAAMYLVLNQWADIEAQLDDPVRANRYQNAARKLKISFNKATDDGGLWEPHNQWYVHWRDKDGSIHGNNLVTHGVNFGAIGYGICDDVERRKAVLDQIEEQMQREDLFHWPICMYSYDKEEGHPMNFPFPKYVNGNIWLCGGELGIRSYAEYDPAIAVKYVRKLIEQYKVDNLAHERYLRSTQTGLGADILGGNANTIVGLYRNIYGIQPKYNRLYLNPHLTTDLNGTRLNYRLRNQQYLIELSYADYAISVNGFRIRSTTDFAVSSFGRKARYFCGSSATCLMSVTKSVDDAFKIDIDIWSTSPRGPKRWTEICDNVDATAEHLVADLEPNTIYMLYNNGKLLGPVRSNSAGCIKFNHTAGYADTQTFEIKYGFSHSAESSFNVFVGQRQLFLDDYGVDKIENLTRRMHRPLKKGAVIEPDRPWEMSLQTRVAPQWDPQEKLYKMWYICSGPTASGTCYAESTDGLDWAKPNQYQCEVDGSLENNFVTVDPNLDWAWNCIVNAVYDPCDPNPARRYKGFQLRYPDYRQTLSSPDGIHWSYLNFPTFIASQDESNMSYDRETGTFIATVKQGGPYGRSVWLTTSKDFEQWSEPELIFHTDELDQKLARKNIAERLANPALAQPVHNDPACYNADVYNMGIFRYEGLYIGLPAIYHSTGKEGNHTDGFHLVQLACSRDLHNWQRLGGRQPFIGPSTVASGAYDLTQILPPSNPVLHGDELWFYYTGINYRVAPEGAEHRGAICLAVLRRDGFISLDADEKEGSIVTKTFVLCGSKLYVNADAAQGWVRVDVLSSAGEELIRSEPLRGDCHRGKVIWKKGDMQELNGRTVALRFTLKNGSFYSYWFDD